MGAACDSHAVSGRPVVPGDSAVSRIAADAVQGARRVVHAV